MILFIRDKNNNTIVDLEIYEVDDETGGYVELHSTVMIDTYSKFLLENLSESKDIILIFQQLSEMREWMWEVYFMGRKNNKAEYGEVLKEVQRLLQGVANEYNLIYTED